ncbi:hypothetical protein [Microtetraspora sp. NBRC 16547]|uniref:hypothetical protein n=1 Tax=Microtetraspora sp. NBRC 16547 TaxID=3030993 RepID=UPI0025559CC4|nr:hypothetical protein [Microtetraspora sp. NBRC 16547]
MNAQGPVGGESVAGTTGGPDGPEQPDGPGGRDGVERTLHELVGRVIAAGEGPRLPSPDARPALTLARP